MASVSQQEPYEIVGPLGGGGMSLVFRARDRQGRAVVLKKLRPELAKNPRIVAAFLREAQITERLQHDNIVRVLATAPDHIVLELVDGCDVATLLELLYEREQALPLPVVISLFRDLCAGLAAAHEQGIVHRDITAGNVLVGWDGVAKVTDFGIAKATTGKDQKLTRTGTTKGTLAYMAPEQILGEATDHRVDVYAATVVFYELLTRFNPFLGENDFDTMSRIIEAPLPPLRELREDAPPRLDAVCVRGLFRDPERRFGSVNELSREVASLRGAHADVRKFLAPLKQALRAFAEQQRLAEEQTAPPVALPEPVALPPLPSRPIDPLQHTMHRIEVPAELLRKK